MPEIRTEFLFTIALEVEVSVFGDTPYGSRRVGRFGRWIHGERWTVYLGQLAAHLSAKAQM